MIEIPTFSKFWALLYPSFSMEGTWKPGSYHNGFALNHNSLQVYFFCEKHQAKMTFWKMLKAQ